MGRNNGRMEWWNNGKRKNDRKERNNELKG
jgi:hypothetical protein